MLHLVTDLCPCLFQFKRFWSFHYLYKFLEEQNINLYTFWLLWPTAHPNYQFCLDTKQMAFGSRVVIWHHCCLRAFCIKQTCLQTSDPSQVSFVGETKFAPTLLSRRGWPSSSATKLRHFYHAAVSMRDNFVALMKYAGPLLIGTSKTENFIHILAIILNCHSMWRKSFSKCPQISTSIMDYLKNKIKKTEHKYLELSLTFCRLIK